MGVIAAVAVLVMLASLTVVDARMLPASRWSRSIVLSLGCAATGVISWLVLAPAVAPQVVGPLLLPIAGLAGVAVYLPSIAIRAAGGIPIAAIGFGLCWSTLVFVPTAIMSFELFGSDTPFGLAPLDHGGSLAMNVAGGAAVLGVLLASGRRASGVPGVAIGRGALTLGLIALTGGWLGWLAAAELALDAATPDILINGMVGAVTGIAGWIFVQGLRHHEVTVEGIGGGLVSGLVAVSAGAPLLTPVSAAIAGGAAGVGAALFTISLVRRSGRSQWYLVGSHLIAGAIGFVLLGALATGLGYVFTGDTGITWTGVFSFFERQALSTLLVAAWSTGVALVLWTVLRRVGGVRPQSPLPAHPATDG